MEMGEPGSFSCAQTIQGGASQVVILSLSITGTLQFAPPSCTKWAKKSSMCSEWLTILCLALDIYYLSFRLPLLQSVECIVPTF